MFYSHLTIKEIQIYIQDLRNKICIYEEDDDDAQPSLEDLEANLDFYQTLLKKERKKKLDSFMQNTTKKSHDKAKEYY